MIFLSISSLYMAIQKGLVTFFLYLATIERWTAKINVLYMCNSQQPWLSICREIISIAEKILRIFYVDKVNQAW